jgi:hypothetical protein
VKEPHGHKPRLRVKEQDADPTVEGVREIRVPNGTLTDEGKGIVSLAYDPAGTGDAEAAAHVLAHAGDDDAHHAVFIAATHTAIGDSAPHHAAVTLAADADELLSLTGQAIGFDTQTANQVLAGPTTGAAADPDFRALVAADIPDVSATYVPKALFDAQSVLAATADNTPAAVTVAEQRVVGRLTGGNIDDITIGIADDNILQVDQASTADDNDYAKFTANGIEGRSYAEVISDLGLKTVATDTIWAAAGDLAVGTGNDTAGVLAKGTDGKVLTMVAGAVAWAAAAGGGGVSDAAFSF